MKILVMEASPFLQAGIIQHLPAAEVDLVSDFETLKARLVSAGVDCVVLNISSAMDMFAEVVETIKHISKRVGLILISDDDNLTRKIEALIAGADDYLTKPYEVSELAARIISLSRRVILSKEEDLVFDEIRTDMNAKMAYVNGKEVDLTKKELELLQYFIEHKNTVIQKETLMSFLSGQSKDFLEAVDRIYAHVKNLKKKLRSAGCKPFLKTIYGIGYRWETQ
jgi:DNA-binding response OmpR family regulator